MVATLKKVAVVDDDPTDGAMLARLLNQRGFSASRIIPPNSLFKNFVELEGAVAGYDYVVCDHKLRQKNYANFEGAMAVGLFNKHKKPALLITQYISPEQKEIKRHRAFIPYIVSRDQTTETDFSEKFDLCVNEISGHPSLERKRHRVPIKIEEFKGDEVVAFVPAWNPQRAVTFPLDIIPGAIQKVIAAVIAQKEMGVLFAEVNIGASHEEFLFFDNFEEAPSPPKGFLE